MVKKITHWLPALVWMALIFYLSGRPGLKTSSDVSLDFVFRKFAHLAEYAILFLLLYRSFGKVALNRSLLASISFAFTDEIHQMFVPTRGSALRDVAIDIIGIGIGCLLLVWLKSPYNKLLRTLRK